MNKISMDEIKLVFEKNSLPPPYIDPKFAENLYKINDSIYGSRREIKSLYGINTYFYEILEGDIEDYFLTGFDGHGINSWTVHYYYVTQALGVLIQLPWGGIYGNIDQEKDTITANFQSAEFLIKRIKTLQNAKQLDPTKRLVVKVSPLTESKWAWVPLKGAKENTLEWHTSQPTIIDASLSIQ